MSSNGQDAALSRLRWELILLAATKVMSTQVIELEGFEIELASFPWSVAAAPAADFVYVTNSGSDDISAYKIKKTGALKPIAGSPFMAGSVPLSIAIDSVQMFTYVTNDVSDNISAYKIDPNTGALESINGSPFGAGMSPNSVVVDPSRKFLYVNNASSDDISAYSIDPVTGSLREIPGSPFTEWGGEPSSIAVSGVRATAR